MTGMQLKDYYRILEVAPGAQLQEIKRSYRRLAHQFHPDKNSGSFASVRFQELHDAYHILSHPEKRRKYDEERWLAGMSNRAGDKVIITPEWLLAEAIKLRKHIAKVDVYRMSRSALCGYVKLILSDSHMAILEQNADDELNQKIANEILVATKLLGSPYIQEVYSRLTKLAGNNIQLSATIHAIMESKIRSEQRSKQLPYMVIAITLLLCLLMYVYGRLAN